ncbi:MAG: type II toxin-antitoxin system RelE/ParE family toxin [Synechococcales bacterium]|nr:type II toxin-antitoxin system RelE/ParE family toxin [Synechococcales bacterium]
MSYTVIISRTVEKQLDALPEKLRLQVLTAIAQLAEMPRPIGVKKLKGEKDEYRLRFGDYRLRYKINDKELLILVIQLKHRKDIYRDLK